MTEVTNLERKLLRSLLNWCFDYSIVIVFDKYIDNSHTNIDDKDVLSLFEILKMIKSKIEINERTILFVYDSLFPSLTKIKIGDNYIREIIDDSKKDYNNKTFYNILITFLSFKFLGNLRYPLAVIFANIIYFNMNNEILYIPVFYFKKIEQYGELSKLHLLENEMQQIIDLNKEHQKKKEVITIPIIKEKLESISKYILKLLNIHSIYLYGSYAKGTNNEYSDIDFHIVLNDSDIDLDVAAMNIKLYFDEIFEIPVDVRTTVYNEWYDSKYDIVFINEIQVL